jgi:hypothetical protein
MSTRDVTCRPRIAWSTANAGTVIAEARRVKSWRRTSKWQGCRAGIQRPYRIVELRAFALCILSVLAELACGISVELFLSEGICRPASFNLRASFLR